MSRNRNWIFTINADDHGVLPTHDEILDCIDAKYMIFQLEQGEQGRLHYQGYCHMPSARTMSSMKRALGARAHLEIRRGTHQQAKEYCSKEETRIAGPWHKGEEPEQGKSSASRQMCEKIVDLNTPITEIAKEDVYTYARNERMMRAARSLAQQIKQAELGERLNLKTIVFWGPTGTGKSRMVSWIVKKMGLRAYRSIAPTRQGIRWNMNNYDGESTLIIEDYNHFPENTVDLLNILDIYPYAQYAMYGQVYPVWDTIFITSNFDPTTWGEGAQYEAVQRRLTHVLQFHSEVPWDEHGPVVPDNFFEEIDLKID